MPGPSPDSGVPHRALLGLALLTALGLTAELVLLEHHDGNAQKIPLGLLAVGIPALLLALFRPSPKAIRALQGVAAAQTIAGAVGVGLHFKGNREFELEMTPNVAGPELWMEALHGATPTLAPGALLALGLLGLLATWKHPAR